MTTKDRNLSLDRNLFRPKATHNQAVQRGNTRKVAGPTAHSPDFGAAGGSAPYSARSWQNITTIGIAITNMLFLVLAGIWLFERNGGAPLQADLPNAGIAPQLALMQSAIEQRINALERQVDDLQIAINGQQDLIISAYQDMGALIKKEGGKPAVSPDDAASGASSSQDAPATSQVKSDPGWYINLGSFPDKQTAFEIQKQFQALGYAATTQTITIDNQTSYSVILPGFKDQASAEMTVNQLLGHIELDGLSVWKEK